MSTMPPLPSFHARIMNVPARGEPAGGSMAYKLGHREARHAAAEIANEADALIADLLARLRAAEADAERYRWMRDVGDETWRPMAARVAEGAQGIDAAIDAARNQP
jgi:hypothetical protein